MATTYNIKLEFGYDYKPGVFVNLVNTPQQFRIAPNQPINTTLFEEAVVLEWNGALTPAGLKEYKSPFIKEGDYKPIIDFINSIL